MRGFIVPSGFVGFCSDNKRRLLCTEDEIYELDDDEEELEDD